MTTKTQLIIKNKLYDTTIKEHKDYIGNYYEIKLFNYFLNNNINIKHISENDKYSSYDFIMRYNKKNYIVELKSRLGNIRNHNIEFISYSKINNYKIILKKNPNTNFIFIFNHIDNENEYNFFYYEVNFDFIEKLELKLIKESYAYILPIENIKPIDNFINIK